MILMQEEKHQPGLLAETIRTFCLHPWSGFSALPPGKPPSVPALRITPRGGDVRASHQRSDQPLTGMALESYANRPVPPALVVSGGSNDHNAAER
jgi:hypothetical protein